MRPVEGTCLEVGWGTLDHDVGMKPHKSFFGVPEVCEGDQGMKSEYAPRVARLTCYPLVLSYPIPHY
jgi:hypothetical protein